MITISRATKEDLAAIEELMIRHPEKAMALNSSYFTTKDIALQARNEMGILVGFSWVGLMAANKIGCMLAHIADSDNIKVHLSAHLQEMLTNKGVKQMIFGKGI